MMSALPPKDSIERCPLCANCGRIEVATVRAADELSRRIDDVQRLVGYAVAN
jgi:hypothetical protein